MEASLTRRLPSIDDVADGLESFLETGVAADAPVILISHSQGGLVVQRFLARTLARGQGHRLARIRSIIMFSCPNSGSDFAIGVRRAAFIWGNAQERELRPLRSILLETQATVVNQVIHATGTSSSECPIPIRVYAGASDQIVPPATARGSFPFARTIPGDHFNIIQPASHRSDSYVAVKAALLDAKNKLPGPGALKECTDRMSHPSKMAEQVQTTQNQFVSEPEGSHQERNPTLTVAERAELVDLILKIPGMLDPQFRQELYNSLSVSVHSHVRRHPDSRVEILGLIQVFQRVPNLKPWPALVSSLTALLPPEQPDGTRLISRLYQLDLLT